MNPRLRKELAKLMSVSMMLGSFVPVYGYTSSTAPGVIRSTSATSATTTSAIGIEDDLNNWSDVNNIVQHPSVDGSAYTHYVVKTTSGAILTSYELAPAISADNITVAYSMMSDSTTNVGGIRLYNDDTVLGEVEFSGADFNANQWMDVELVYTTDNDDNVVIDMFVDGTAVSTTYGASDVILVANKIEFFNSPSTSGAFYYDKVSVSGSDNELLSAASANTVGEIVFFDDFSATELSSDWTRQNTSNGTVQIEDGALNINHTVSGSSAPKAYVIFDEQSSQFGIEFDFTMINDASPDGTTKSTLSCAFGTMIGSTNITSSSSEALRFKSNYTISGDDITSRAFTYTDAGSTSTVNNISYELGKTYTIAFVTDPVTQLTNIYIDGELLVKDAAYKTTYSEATVVDRFIFQADSSGAVNYTIDNFMVWTGDYSDKPGDSEEGEGSGDDTTEPEVSTGGFFEEDFSNWTASNSGEIISHPFTSEGYVATISGISTSSSFTYSDFSVTSEDAITVSFKMLGEDFANFSSGGIKLYEGSTELSRINFSTGRIRYRNASGSTVTIVDTADGMQDDLWYDVSFIFYPSDDGDVMLFDVYLSGKLMGSGIEGMASNVTDGKITIDSFRMYSDSTCTGGTIYLDEIMVQEGKVIPSESQPASPYNYLEESAENWTLATSSELDVSPFRDMEDDIVLYAGKYNNIYTESFSATDAITINFDVVSAATETVSGIVTNKVSGDVILNDRTNDIFTLTFDGEELKAGAQTLATGIDAFYWNDISIVLKESGADVYLNGEKVGDNLSTSATSVGFETINFKSSNSYESDFIFNDITVRTTEVIPSAGEPVKAYYPDQETDKPDISHYLKTIEAMGTLDAAYPEPNIYNSGLDGYEIVGPEVVAGATTHNVQDALDAAGVADGEDVTDVVQSLIDNAEYGDTVYFPQGTYNFITTATNAITLKDGVSLIGEGEDQSILKISNTSSATSAYFIRGTGVTNLAIKDLTLTSAYYGDYSDSSIYAQLGTNTTREGNMSHGIYLDRNTSTGQPCQYIEIENVTVEIFKTMAIALRNTQDVRVKGCTVQYPTDVAGGGAGYGVTVQGTADTDNWGQPYDSMNNIVEDCTLIGLRHGILLQYYTHNNLVINNKLVGMGYGAIDLHGEDEYLNEIAFNYVADTHWGGGIELGNSGAGHDLAGPLNFVHNNTVDGGLRGIDIEFGTPDTIVQNNTVKNISNTNNTSDSNGAAIRIRNAERTSVSGNTFTDNVTGILFDTDSGYSWGDLSDWGAGTPFQSDVFDNTVSGNGTDYILTAGNENTVLGQTADGTIVVEKSANAHLVALEPAEAEFTTAFIPYITDYTIFVPGNELTLTPHASASNVGKIVINGAEVPNGESIILTDTKVDIVVTSEDGANTKTYSIAATYAAGDDYVPVQNVQLQGSEPTIPNNDSYQLEVSVLPTNATNQKLIWEIIDGNDIMSIDQNGLLTPLTGAGDVVVRATSDESESMYAEFTVTVIEAPTLPDHYDETAEQLSVVAVTDSGNDGNGPDNIADGDLTTRWSNNEKPGYVALELADSAEIAHVKVAWNSGNTRKSYFNIYVTDTAPDIASADNVDTSNWNLVYTDETDGYATSSGLMTLPEACVFDEPIEGKYVIYEGLGNEDSAWNSVLEIEVYGHDGETTTPTPDEDKDDDAQENEIIYSTTFDTLDSSWTTQNTSYDNVSAQAVDGALQIVDENDEQQVKAFVTFDAQTEPVTIQYDFRIDTNEYATTLTSAFGKSSITSSSNEALRFTTTGSTAGEQQFRYTNGVDADGATINAVIDGAIEIDKWYNIAFTTDPTTGKTVIYIDGTQVAVSESYYKDGIDEITNYIFQTGGSAFAAYSVDNFIVYTGEFNAEIWDNVEEEEEEDTSHPGLIKPSDVLTLDDWKLQLPIVSGTGILEIQKDSLDGYSHKDYFYYDEDIEGVVFYCPVDGGKTANTVYSRTELREMIGTSTADNWDFAGTHILNTSQKVTEVPSNGNVVTSQIHSIYPDGSNGPALIKVQYEGNDERILVMFKSSTDDTAADVKMYVNDIKLDQVFDTEIKLIDGYGYVTVTSEGVTTELSYDFMGIDPTWDDKYNNYFKAGNYIQDSVQDDPDGPTEGATVIMYSLETYHSDEVEDVKIESLDFVRSEIELALGDTTTLQPVFTPVDTYNKKLTYTVTEGAENVAVGIDGTILGLNKGEATILATSQSDGSVTAEIKVTVVDEAEEVEAELIASWDFSKALSEYNDLTISVPDSGATVEIVDGYLQVIDDTLLASTSALASFPEQTGTTTISYKIRLDENRVKDADSNKPLSSVIYVDVAHNENMSSSVTRVRNTGDYNTETEGLDNQRWQVTNNYSDVDMNEDAAVVTNDWQEFTIITTPNNGTGLANTTDVYIDGVMVGYQLTDNNVADSINRVRFMTGTKDLIDFSLDDVKVYSGAKLPDNITNAAPTQVTVTAETEELVVGDTLQLIAAVLPADASPDVTYEVIDGDTVVGVSKNGLVIAKAEGTATIRVATKADESVYFDFVITVTADSTDEGDGDGNEGGGNEGGGDGNEGGGNEGGGDGNEGDGDDEDDEDEDEDDDEDGGNEGGGNEGGGNEGDGDDEDEDDEDDGDEDDDDSSSDIVVEDEVNDYIESLTDAELDEYIEEFDVVVGETMTDILDNVAVDETDVNAFTEILNQTLSILEALQNLVTEIFANIPTLANSDVKEAKIDPDTAKFGERKGNKIQYTFYVTVEYTVNVNSRTNETATMEIGPFSTWVSVDNTAPTFSEQHEDTYSILVGDSFTLPVVTATDASGDDVEVTSEITRNGTVVDSIDTDTAGTYIVTYTATDADGNTAETTITVRVLLDGSITGDYNIPTFSYPDLSNSNTIDDEDDSDEEDDDSDEEDDSDEDDDSEDLEENEDDVDYVSLINVEEIFTDINKSAWYYSDIAYVYSLGLIKGVTETEYEPSSYATRAQLATILNRIAGNVTVTSGNEFTDVVAGAWYESAINWAVATGVYNGYEDGTFRPSESITREQLAVIMFNFANSQGYTTAANASLNGFTDSNEVASWATTAVQWTVANGIIGGKDNNRLDPKGEATRAEIAAIITRFLN
ncbi:MAG: hypothetical protein BEN18_04195 [Epulopiscium sp. Nuni2H_MBin001]|nr:MAG: hypothetical protein BEN18_04195 [Epulopiscium sp. Nuni2H_MBin001]